MVFTTTGVIAEANLLERFDTTNSTRVSHHIFIKSMRLLQRNNECVMLDSSLVLAHGITSHIYKEYEATLEEQ